MKERHARLFGLSTTYITKVGTTPVRHTSPGNKAHNIVVKKPNFTQPFDISYIKSRGGNCDREMEVVAWGWVYEAVVAKNLYGETNARHSNISRHEPR